MEIIKVGIYLEDSDFAELLAEGLSREYRGFQIYLLDGFDRSDEMDIVLATHPSGQPHVVEACTEALMGEDVMYAEGDTTFRVFVYKDCPDLINDLLYIYFRLTGKICSYRGEGACKTVFFCSDCSGGAVTRLSIETGKAIEGVYGQKVLYVNLCAIDYSYDFVNHEEGNLLRLLYYLRNSVDFPINNFITEACEPDCLKTGIINSYTDEIDAELFHKLLARIEELGKYNYVLVDVGNHLNRANRELISNSDIAVMVVNETTVAGKAVSEEISRLRGSDKLISVSMEERDSYGNAALLISKKIVEDCKLEFEK